MWRNQDRDLSLLHSLLDDLKQYWQWKAAKWEKVAHEIHHTRNLKGYRAEEEEEESILRRSLLGDEDYRDLFERLKVELDETKSIYAFLGYDPPEELEAMDLEAALIPNEILEPVIEDLEWILPVCKEIIYPLKHVRAAIRQPRQWLCDFYDS